MKIYHKREKVFATLLRKQKRKYTYQVQRFKLKNSYYQPDFYLPEENLYIELAGTRQAYSANKKKYEEFKLLYPNLNFQIVKYTEKEHKQINKTAKQRGYFIHSVALNVEQEAKLWTQHGKGWTIINLLRLGIEKSKEQNICTTNQISKVTSNGKYLHSIALTPEQETQLKMQREKGWTIIGLLFVGISMAEASNAT